MVVLGWNTMLFKSVSENSLKGAEMESWIFSRKGGQRRLQRYGQIR